MRKRCDVDRLVEMVRLHRIGIPDRTATRMLKMGPNTHRHARECFRQAGIWDGGPELPTYEMLRATLPQNLPPQQISNVEPWKDSIRTMVYGGLEAKVIHSRLRLDFPDFSASYYSVKRFVAALLRDAITTQDQVVIPVETGPGEVAQVDFAYVGLVIDPADGVKKKAWFFLMTLGYSRHFYARVVFDQTVPTWLDLHVRAFTFFGGVPKVVVPDNLKSAVIRTSFGLDPDLEAQRNYRELARHYGFLIDPAPPRSPEKKGKVERNVAYVESFLASRTEDANRDELNRDLERWNKEIASLRIHGTTTRVPMEMFGEEKSFLLPLGPKPYLQCLWRHTQVQPNAHAFFERRYYSVPWKSLGKEVWIRAIPDRVFLYVEDQLVAEHARYGDSIYSTLPGHLPERAALAHRDPKVWQERASKIGRATRSWVDLQFETQDGVSHLSRVQGAVLFLESLPKDRAEAVCQRALAYGLNRVAELKSMVLHRLDQIVEPSETAAPTRLPKFARRIGDLTRGHQEGANGWN